MKQYTTNCRCRNEKISDGVTVDYLLKDERVSDIIKDLCGTGTTAKLIAKETGLTVQGYLSGPLGGDLEIGAKVAKPLLSAVPTLSPRGKADDLYRRLRRHFPQWGKQFFYNADKSLKKSEKNVIINPIQ